MSKKALLAIKEPRITTPKNKQNGILSWDVDNNYPARMRNIIADSVTAQNCLKVYNRFVGGRGFADEVLSKAVINTDGETADALLRKIVADKGFINAVAIHINYNQAFERVEARHIRIDDVRLAIDRDKVAIHPNWELREDKQKFKKSDIDFIDLFDPSPETITAQVEAAGGWENYKGQVFYWSPIGVEYTAAPYDAAAEDMQTEGSTKTFRNRVVGQNFMPSQYIVVDDIESEDEETEGNSGESFADIIVGTVKQFQGAENTASVMVIQKPSPDTTFEMHVPDLQHFDGMYEKTEKSTDSAILRGFMMPRPLILEGGDALFASGTILETAQSYYSNITDLDRQEVAYIAQTVFNNWETPICPSGDYSILPIVVKKKITAEYFPFFTKNEIRESLDAPAAEETDANTKLLVETLGVGGTQALVTILTDPVLQPPQKIATLIKLFNFTQAEAESLVLVDNTNPAT